MSSKHDSLESQVAWRFNQLGMPAPEDISPEGMKQIRDFIRGEAILVITDMPDGEIKVEFVIPKK